MSGAWEIPAASVGRQSVLDALASSKDLPVEAIDRAMDNPEWVAIPVIEVVGRAGRGEPLSDRDRNLLFWGIHVLGAARETRLFGPLLALLRRPDDEIEACLEDALTETVPAILAGAFDGDPAILFQMLASPATDEFVRMGLFGTLAYLTFEGRIARPDTEAFLIRFDETRPARAGEAGWHGWETAIALLGLRDLAPRVHAAHEDARLLGDIADPDWFEALLAVSEAQPNDRERFEAENLAPFDDPVAALERALGDPEDAEPGQPVVNPLRNVGRNDPCPCGSGKKFKKCCLAA